MPIKGLFLGALLFLLSACGQHGESTSDVEQKRRLVVLGGELAETVVALGHEQSIVAVDTTSQWPPSLRALPNVGYLRQLNFEGVLSLRPDIILASHEAGPPEILERWRQLGVDVRQVTTGPQLGHAVSAIQQVGELLGETDEANSLVESITRALDQVQNPISAPQVLLLMSKTGNQMLTAGLGTKAHVMIEVSGGHNAGATFRGYKPLSAEALIALAPDVVLVPSHALGSFGGPEGLKRDAVLQLTPAGQHDQIVVVDSQLMLSMGPRLAEAVTTLSEHFRTAARQDDVALQSDP